MAVAWTFDGESYMSTVHRIISDTDITASVATFWEAWNSILLEINLDSGQGLAHLLHPRGIDIENQ